MLISIYNPFDLKKNGTHYNCTLKTRITITGGFDSNQVPYQKTDSDSTRENNPDST